MQNWRKIIITIALAAFIFLYFFVVPKISEMLRQDRKQDFMIHLTLISYCDDQIGDNDIRTNETAGTCSDWADQFSEEHQDIIRECGDLADNGLRPFSGCMNEAGAQQYLPSD